MRIRLLTNIIRRFNKSINPKLINQFMETQKLHPIASRDAAIFGDLPMV